MELNGLGAGRLRGSIKDVGMNEKSTEIQRSPFRLRKMEDRPKNEDKGGLGIGQKNKTAYNYNTRDYKLVVVNTGVSNTSDGMGLNNFDGLGAGQLRSSIIAVCKKLVKTQINTILAHELVRAISQEQLIQFT